jgi:hypothetical protein
MSFSEMLSRVALVRNDISDGPSATMIRVKIFGVLRTVLAVNSCRRTLQRNAIYSISSQRASTAILL